MQRVLQLLELRVGQLVTPVLHDVGGGLVGRCGARPAAFGQDKQSGPAVRRVGFAV